MVILLVGILGEVVPVMLKAKSLTSGTTPAACRVDLTRGGRGPPVSPEGECDDNFQQGAPQACGVWSGASRPEGIVQEIEKGPRQGPFVFEGCHESSRQRVDGVAEQRGEGEAS